MDPRFLPRWLAAFKELEADLALVNKERQRLNRAANNAARKNAAERAADRRQRSNEKYCRRVAEAKATAPKGSLEGVDACKCPTADDVSAKDDWLSGQFGSALVSTAVLHLSTLLTGSASPDPSHGAR